MTHKCLFSKCHAVGEEAGACSCSDSQAARQALEKKERPGTVVTVEARICSIRCT